MIDALFEAGMDVVRLNFSHGTPPEHAKVVERVRDTSKQLERPVSVIHWQQGNSKHSVKFLQLKNPKTILILASY